MLSFQRLLRVSLITGLAGLLWSGAEAVADEAGLARRIDAPGAGSVDAASRHSEAARRLSGSADPGSRDCAIEEWKLLPQTSGKLWIPIGPNPIVEQGCCVPFTFAANGRVNSIAVDPTNSDVVYLGSAGGGVWKSVDGGGHWKPMSDREISLGIGSAHAIAIDPQHANTIYAGTSSFAMLDQSLPRPIDSAQSRGILRSTDGGSSWILLGSGVPTWNDGNAATLFCGVNINTIIVDPADSNVLYLAAGRGDDPISGGAFFSLDRGFHWKQGAGTENMMVESLVLDSSSPRKARVLYAGAWEQGVLKSSDGGKTWTPVLQPSTTMTPYGFKKTMVAIAPPANPPLQDGAVVYASLWKNGPPGERATELLFSNSEGGADGKWVQRKAHVVKTAFFHGSPPVPDPLFSQGFSDMVVDPASPGDGIHDRVFWGAGTQFLSTDSGDTFNEIGQINGTHGDHQTFLVVPHPGGSTVYVGDDGGIWRSDDSGDHWTGTTKTSSPNISELSSTINSGGLQIATLYQLAAKPDSAASATLGGAQDSGVLRSPPPASVPALPAWQPWSGTSHDGIDVAFDKVAPNVAYSIDNDAFYESTNGGDEPWPWAINFSAKLPSDQIAVFKNRFAVDPNNTGILYVGGSGNGVPPDILQTRDGAVSFRSLKFSSLNPSGYVSSLDVAPGDSNHLVASADRRVFVATYALASDVGPPSGVVFQDITGDLPSRYVTRVAFDPNHANVVYATLAGFGGGHVFRKSISVENWTDISPHVDIPVNAIALDGTFVPAVIYIGTDLGVLRSEDGGSSWDVVDGIHLPNAAVSDLDWNGQAGVLRAGTWGRGVFELAPPSGPVIFVEPSELRFGETCAVSGQTLTIEVSNVGTQNLVINGVQRIAGSADFNVLPSPTTPLTIGAGSHVVFAVQFIPTTPATVESAIIRISSSDPRAPVVDLLATGMMETTPPNISALSAIPDVLWPPNHKMDAVSLQITVSDACDSKVGQSCHITSITSSEPISGTGDGDTSPDWEITGKLTANLRAERAGSGAGRTYTLTVECTDSAGNVSRRATVVRVLHD